jgi:hypothetical protein
MEFLLSFVLSGRMITLGLGKKDAIAVQVLKLENCPRAPPLIV